MKKLLIAATALTAFVATPALADGDNQSTDTETFTINAFNPAKCNLEATTYTLTLPTDSLSDNDGFAKTGVGATVAAALNGAGVTAWCTGASNKLQLYRTAFKVASGDQLASGFNQGLVYDVAVEIAGATRSDSSTPLEGTSDGQGNGPGLGIGAGLTVSAFGAAPGGATVTFQNEGSSTSYAAANAGAATTGATSSFTTSPNRLVAGQYQSLLTIEVTPGV